MLRQLNSIILLAAICIVTCQENEGDQCVDKYTNTNGRCKPVAECQSAQNDFQLNGITPTFCTLTAFGSPLVCCRDGSTILQTASTKDNQSQPAWSPSDNNKRVSERKCEEYSKGVIETVEYIALLPDPETMTISAAKCDYTGVELIVGGEDAKQGEFPHMAAIGWANFEGGYSYFCGGSLISPRFVLSAGHCLIFRSSGVADPAPVTVRLGDQNIDPAVKDGANPYDVPIRKSYAHPDYASPSKYNDIALFELATDIKFSATVRAACLWTQPGFGIYTKAVATGWGVLDPDSRQSSKELQKVALSLMNNTFCDPVLQSSRNRHWNGFRDSQLCAGELRGGKDTCQGDSGSPLQVTSKDNQCIFYIMGITSFGKSCGKSDRPAVYTRVSSYVTWIESIVWPGE